MTLPPGLITACLFFASLHSVTSVPDGSGSGLSAVVGWLAECESCVKEIYSIRWTRDTCESISPAFASCMETCSHLAEPGTNPINTAHVQALSWIFGILERLRVGDCAADQATLFITNGCSSKVLTCVQNVAKASTYSKESLGSFNCSDSSLSAMYGCFEDEADCVWRTPLETITAKARRSVCESNDRCIVNGNLYLGEQQCRAFRFGSLNYLDYMKEQHGMLTAPGTLFNPERCSIVHANRYTCRIP